MRGLFINKDNLRKWKEEVAEFNKSGNSIDGWCRLKGISPSNFRYHKKQVEKHREQIVEEKFVEIPFSVSKASSCENIAVTLSKKDVKVEIHNGADITIVTAVCEVLSLC